MENFGGRACLTDNRLGPNYVANRALQKQEKWLDKVSCANQRLLSREEAKMRKSLERLRAVKSTTKSRANQKSRFDTEGATPAPSRLGGHASHYDRDNISHQPSRHKRDHNGNLDSASQYHGPHGLHPEGQPRHAVRSRMKIHDQPRRRERSGCMTQVDKTQDNHHDSASQVNNVLVPINKKKGPEQHQETQDDGPTTPGKLTLPQIQNLNQAMAHHHVPMTVITVDDHDDDDDHDHGHVDNAGSNHIRPKKITSSSLKSIYDDAIYKIKSFHDPSPRYSENNSTSSIQSDSKRHKHSVEKLPEIDRQAFRDLESIIKDAKARSSKKESFGGNSNYTSRHHKRRLQHLEQLLEELRPRVKPEVVFDPISILECRYLRLSKANIENLENMIREKGGDPGIHAHTDVSNYNIWS